MGWALLPLMMCCDLQRKRIPRTFRKWVEPKHWKNLILILQYIRLYRSVQAGLSCFLSEKC